MPFGTPPVDRLIVGLGNPGREYSRSRHNVGFMVADELGRKWGVRYSHRWSDAQVGVGRAAGLGVAIAKPQTYMNLSGDSVRGLLKRLRLEPTTLVVVYDDLDLPLGRVRIRENGSAGGHRGVQSIIDRLGTQDFLRVRLGIGRPDPRGAAEYVLAEFSEAERIELKDAVSRAAEAVAVALAEGSAAAMNRFNR
jgi:peptidyl-tRNA hydrolase, PTH1 family